MLCSGALSGGRVERCHIVLRQASRDGVAKYLPGQLFDFVSEPHVAARFDLLQRQQDVLCFDRRDGHGADFRKYVDLQPVGVFFWMVAALVAADFRSQVSAMDSKVCEVARAFARFSSRLAIPGALPAVFWARAAARAWRA